MRIPVFAKPAVLGIAILSVTAVFADNTQELNISEHLRKADMDAGSYVMVLEDDRIMPGDLESRDGITINVGVSAEGGAFRIRDEKVPVKDLRYAPEAFRIGIDFKQKQKSGSITMVFTPGS